MQTILIFCLVIITGTSSTPLNFPEPVLREIEIMLGEKINPEEIFSSETPCFDAYKDVEFELYTYKNPEEHQRVLIDNIDSLKSSNYDPQYPSRFLIHGGFSNGTNVAIQLPRAGYMKKGKFNVFGVNWAKGALKKDILFFRKHMEDVGKTVATFIQFLIREGDASMDDMAVIGHSAGATTVSFVGKALNGTLPVIISLDPPNFFLKFTSGKSLPEKSDAKYVEVLHAVMLYEPVGHADFYANGGRHQPSCVDKAPGMDEIMCNHMVAIDYFAESISSDTGFWSKKCTSFEDMTSDGCPTNGEPKKLGGEPISTIGGVYWLRTNKNPPFARGLE